MFILSRALNFLVLCVVSITYGSEYSHNDEDHESRFGTGKAIEAVKDNGRSFQLSDKAIKILSLSYMTISQGRKENEYLIPNFSVANHQEKHTVYIRNTEEKGWFTTVNVELIKNEGDSFLVRSSYLKQGQQIVSNGVEFLRIVQLDVLGKKEKGHAH